jgi:hypothetical protein
MKITINGSSYEAEAEATLVFLLRPNELRAAQATRAEQVAASGWDRDDPQRTQSRLKICLAVLGAIVVVFVVVHLTGLHGH